MRIRVAPDTAEKLSLLGDATRFEPAGDHPSYERAALSSLLPCVTEVSTPKGKKPVLKAMVTTACERGCNYCFFRAGRDGTRRLTFQPDELAHAFDQIQRAKLADGIFISSGIIRGGATVQDKVIDTVEIIRKKYGYQGYVHLKIMPGAEYDQIRRAMQLADRVSINLEGPNEQRLEALAPQKDFATDLLERLRWAHQLREQEGLRASLVTQLVVGAVGDTDVEHLSLSESLYRQMKLSRTYYASFRPVENTPFENLPPASPLRERRLYQASFLLRDYAWDVEDLPFEGDGNLRLDIDPKRAWADGNLREAPVDVMHADRAELLRVPGIGPKSADAILRARCKGRLTELAHLHAIGIRGLARVTPYILLEGRRPPQQLSLLDDA